MTSRRPMFAEADQQQWGSTDRRRSESELDITPMIDVTFLLLIFFMVSSTMQATPDYDVPVAKYGLGVESRSATIVLVKKPEAANSDQPLIQVEGFSTQQLSLEQLSGHLEAQVAVGILKVIIKANRDVPHGLVQQVTRVVASIDGVEFSIGVRDPSR